MEKVVVKDDLAICVEGTADVKDIKVFAAKLDASGNVVQNTLKVAVNPNSVGDAAEFLKGQICCGQIARTFEKKARCQQFGNAVGREIGKF